jgi:hypothetical protein
MRMPPHPKVLSSLAQEVIFKLKSQVVLFEFCVTPTVLLDLLPWFYHLSDQSRDLDVF